MKMMRSSLVCGEFTLRPGLVGFSKNMDGMGHFNLHRADDLLFAKNFERHHQIGELPLDTKHAVHVMVSALAYELLEATPEGRA